MFRRERRARRARREDEQRIFDAVVKPERRAGGRRRRGASASALRKEIARAEGMLANERLRRERACTTSSTREQREARAPYRASWSSGG